MSRCFLASQAHKQVDTEAHARGLEVSPGQEPLSLCGCAPPFCLCMSFDIRKPLHAQLSRLPWKPALWGFQGNLLHKHDWSMDGHVQVWLDSKAWSNANRLNRGNPAKPVCSASSWPLYAAFFSPACRTATFWNEGRGLRICSGQGM